MTDRRVLSAVTLTVLVALLVVGGFLGWRSLSAPLPDPTADAAGSGSDKKSPSCGGFERGDMVQSKDVTVSVFNAGTRSGLAGQTQQQLAARGFIPGDTGNAPDNLSKVRVVRVLAPSKKNPAAKLVARQFGKNTLIQASDRELGPGVEVVVGNDFKGLKKAPRQIKAAAPGASC